VRGTGEGKGAKSNQFDIYRLSLADVMTLKAFEIISGVSTRVAAGLQLAISRLAFQGVNFPIPELKIAAPTSSHPLVRVLHVPSKMEFLWLLQHVSEELLPVTCRHLKPP
jgi:hypothetical protein